jgi:hypothetical protein
MVASVEIRMRSLERHLVLAFFLPQDASCVTISFMTDVYMDMYLPYNDPRSRQTVFGTPQQ